MDLNQPVIINCSVSAVPHPDFQWVQVNSSEGLLSKSKLDGWNSTCTTYSDKTTSILNCTFRADDLNKNCRIHILCIGTNLYGSSYHHFTLSLKSSESYFVVSSISLSPSVSLPTLAVDSSPSDFTKNITTINNLKTPIIAAIVGAIICLALVLVILVVAVCFHKHIYFKHK